MTRANLATKCMFGSFSFWATAASGGGARRLARYKAIGVEGASLEDLGEDERTEELEAYLTEEEWIELDNLRRQGKQLTIVHPLFGVFTGRIEKANYKADEHEGVTASITVVEDGDRIPLLGTTVVNPPAAAASASGAAGNLSDALDSASDLDDLGDPFTDAADALSGALDTWDAVMDVASAGEALWEEVGAAFDSLTDAAGDFIDQLDLVVSEVEGLADLALDDLTYLALDAGRTVVDALGSVAQTTTFPFRVMGECSLASVARTYLGTTDEEAAIEKLITLNPSLIDIQCVPVGFELVIPVES